MATRKLKETPVSPIADAAYGFAGLMSPELQPSCMKLILSTHSVTVAMAIEDHILPRLDQLAHLDRFALDARVILEHDTSKATDRQFKCSIRLRMPGPDL